VKIAPHLKCVTPLPCENWFASGINNIVGLRKWWTWFIVVLISKVIWSPWQQYLGWH